MKKKICKMLLLAALTAAGAMMLTACTSSEKTETVSGTSGSGSSQTVSGAVTSDDTQQTSGAQVSDQVQSVPDSSQSSAEDMSAGGENNSAEDMSAGGENSAEDTSAGDENGAEDVWSGTYVSDSESLTVTLLNDETISFAFAQSGISGTAQVNGSQAVFNGDDYHVVVFSLNGTVLNVAVSSEEDFDASGSPLNGTYILSAG